MRNRHVFALTLAGLLFSVVRSAPAQVSGGGDSGVPMTRPAEVLATHRTNFFHSSTFVQLNSGRILHAAGTTFTTSDDGGITWSKPFQSRDIHGDLVGGGGTGLVKLSGDGIGLEGFRNSKPDALGTAGKSRGGMYCAFWRSEDGGKTWQPPVAITQPGLGTASYQDVLLRTSSGRIILPVDNYIGQEIGPDNRKPLFNGKLVRGQWVSTGAHFFDPHFSSVAVYYSDDDGRTWTRNRDGDLLILLDWNANYNFVSEPSVAEVAPGRLLMLMRNGLGRLFQAWSNDNGETWTRPEPTSLAATTTPSQIRRLPTGHLLVVWNQESEEEVKRGFNRMRLSSAISRNGGSVWEFFQNVASALPGTRVEPGPIHPVRPEQVYGDPGQPAPVRDGTYLGDEDSWVRTSYPSVFVMKDRVIIAYTYSTVEDDSQQARPELSTKKKGSFNQIQKVLPLKWFYGGKEPANNPFLKEAYEPAKP